MSKIESRQHLGRDIRALRDDELEAVTGGANGNSWLHAIALAMGKAADQQASKVQQRL